MKCCGNVPLSQATVALGVMYIVYSIVAAVLQHWISSALSLFACVLCIVVCLKKEDVKVRRAVFIGVTALQVLSMIGLVITAFIYTGHSYLRSL